MMTAQTSTTDDLRAKWDPAWKRMLDAHGACLRYEKAMKPLLDLQAEFCEQHGLEKVDGRADFGERRKALLAANPAFAVPEAMYDECERLCDEYVALTDELMNLPAPDLSALRWKLDRTEGTSWRAEYLAQMHADMDRLIGKAPSIEQVAA
jgi:hypothetical protein